jgi:hypothetical protein
MRYPRQAREGHFRAIPHEKTMHAIELFGKYVIPHFRDRAPVQSAAAGGAS